MATLAGYPRESLIHVRSYTTIAVTSLRSFENDARKVLGCFARVARCCVFFISFVADFFRESEIESPYFPFRRAKQSSHRRRDHVVVERQQQRRGHRATFLGTSRLLGESTPVS